MQKQIVVPLDGSKLGEAILPQVIALAHATHSGIVLLRVITPPHITTATTSMVLPENWYDDELMWTRKYLEARAEQVREAGIEAHIVTLDGDSKASILSYVERPDVRFVAMASHGRAGIGRWLFGSTSTSIIHNTPKPIILIHPSSDETIPLAPIPSYHSIIVALNGSKQGEHVLGLAQQLAQTFEATIILVQVVPDDQLQTGQKSAYLKDKAQALRAVGLTVQTEIPMREPIELIEHLCEQHQDVLVMAAYRDQIEGVVMKFIHNVGVPVLLVPTYRDIPLRVPS